MDRERYVELITEAVGEANRLLAVSNGQNSVVLVVSRAMRNEILIHDGENYVAGNGDGVEEYCGYRVGIINEMVEEEYISPAILGMAYYQGMQLNDAIIVDDENRLFRLESINPVRFTDMGLTGNFGHYTNAGTAGAIDAAVNVTTDLSDAIDAVTVTTQAATITLDDVANAVTNISWNDITLGDITNIGNMGATAVDTGTWWARTPYYYYDAPSYVDYQRPKRKAKKEEELSAGDTRLMDEFLAGFMRNGA